MSKYTLHSNFMVLQLIELNTKPMLYFFYKPSTTIILNTHHLNATRYMTLFLCPTVWGLCSIPWTERRLSFSHTHICTVELLNLWRECVWSSAQQREVTLSAAHLTAYVGHHGVQVSCGQFRPCALAQLLSTALLSKRKHCGTHARIGSVSTSTV